MLCVAYELQVGWKANVAPTETAEARNVPARRVCRMCVDVGIGKIASGVTSVR